MNLSSYECGCYEKIQVMKISSYEMNVSQKINHMIQNVNYLLSKFKFSILWIFN